MARISIEQMSVNLNAVIDEQYRYPREELGKTRPLHPNELLSYAPHHLKERERRARDELYFTLLKRDVVPVRKAAMGRHVPDRNEAYALCVNAIATQDHLLMLRNLGTEFVRASEIVEAEVAECVAVQRYQVALIKNGRAKSFDGCRRPKRHTVTDGVVRTGRYRMIEGVRVPVVKSLEGTS